MKRRIQMVARTIVIIVLACVLFLTLRYNNLIRTVLSLTKISDAPAYEATIYGDFGLAEYCKVGAANHDELQEYCFKVLGLEFLNPKEGKYEHGCSGFYARTPEGDYIICQNYDTYPYQQLPLVIHTHAKSSDMKVVGLANSGVFVRKKGFESLVDKVSVGVAPYLCMDGMNEHGLGIMIATASGSDGSKEKEDRIVMPDETISTALLNNAKDVDEAIEWLSGVTIHKTSYPSHFLIGDATGNSAVIEWIDGEMQVIQTDKNYQVFSNFVLYDNTKLIGFGSDKYGAYEKVLEKSDGVITEEAALELLKENTISAHACWSVVYNLTKHTMKVTFYQDYENIYEFFIEG